MAKIKLKDIPQESIQKAKRRKIDERIITTYLDDCLLVDLIADLQAINDDHKANYTDLRIEINQYDHACELWGKREESDKEVRHRLYNSRVNKEKKEKLKKERAEKELQAYLTLKEKYGD